MTPFGKQLRHLRLDREILAGEMADAMRISPSYLSQIETGKKPIPDGFVDRICGLFGLGPDDAQSMHRAAALSMSEFRIRLDHGSSEADRILANSIALEFARLTPEAKSKISRAIGGNKNV